MHCKGCIAKKCYILSVRQNSSLFYELDSTILQQVNTNPYLGLTLSEDLTWKTHISNICKKANSSLAFLRRNLQINQRHIKSSAYTTLVRPQLEYAAAIWDPYRSTKEKQHESSRKKLHVCKNMHT